MGSKKVRIVITCESRQKALEEAKCGVPREMDSQNTRISSRFVTMLRIPSVSYPAFPKRQYSSGVRYPFEAWNRQRL